MSVTYSRKRYIFKCACCGGLWESNRRDTLTCSPACRVAAHRSGALKIAREEAVRVDVGVERLLHVAAAKSLAPDLIRRLAERKSNGRPYSIYDFQDEIGRAFDRLVGDSI
jgi:hypothetical protein